MYRISTILFVFFFACAWQPLFAQQKQIALHHQGEASFFTSLQAAYDAAVNGDTLYIPGGFFPAIGLGKSLALIGVGHHPDSTAATGVTVLDYLDFNQGSDGSFITGIFFNTVLNCNNLVSEVVMTRCNLKQGIIFHSSFQNSGWIFSENWIGRHTGYGYSIVMGGSSRVNFIISNNVFQSHIGWGGFLSFSVIANNIFLNNSFVSADNSTIRNNVFVTNNFLDVPSSCQWYNNLNAGINGGPSVNYNTGSGNYLDNAPLETVFVNYSGGNTFYQNNFHVVNPAYIGDDGAPVGIYGGLYPWKEGSLPFNPHISSKTISSTTNADGTLHINVDVKAQQN